MSNLSWNVIKKKIATTWLGKMIVLLVIAILSALIYMMGYLFLWGYYFGGNGNISMPAIAVNYIPLNKNVVVLIGLFYFLTIMIISFLFLSIFKEGFSIAKIILMLIAILITNLSLILFFYGEFSFLLFGKMLQLWILPLTTVLAFVTVGCWAKYPARSAKLFGYLLLLTINMIIFNEKLLSNKLDLYIYSDMHMIVLLYFGLPILIFISRIEMKAFKSAFKYFLFITGVAPIVIALFVTYTISSFLISIFLALIAITNNKYHLYSKITKFFIGNKKNKFVRKNEKRPPVIVESPFASSMFIVSTLLILLVFSTNMLIKGGSFFQSMVSKDEYQEITYVWDGDVEKEKGVLVSNKDNIYYISTTDQKLLEVKVDYILAR